MSANSVQLQERQVVNIADGKCLGVVKDIELNIYTGCIEALVLPGLKGFWMRLQHASELRIPWNQVVCIGVDVILVHLPELAETDSFFAKNKSKKIWSDQATTELLAQQNWDNCRDALEENIIILEPDAYREVGK